MRRVVVIEHVTLDGVMQAPGRPDEDTRDGFEHGGWAQDRADEVIGRKMGERMQGGPLLLGRRTYEDFFSFWPTQTDNPYTEALDSAEKYVASTSLKEPLPWKNSTLLDGDAASAVAELKQQPGKDFTVLGSGQLVQSLMRRDLVDELLLMTHPMVFGTGRHLFPDGGAFAELRLTDATTTTTGVVIATYEHEKQPKG
jgi:dihydrofolate reductase